MVATRRKIGNISSEECEETLFHKISLIQNLAIYGYEQTIINKNDIDRKYLNLIKNSNLKIELKKIETQLYSL